MNSKVNVNGNIVTVQLTSCSAGSYNLENLINELDPRHGPLDPEMQTALLEQLMPFYLPTGKYRIVYEFGSGDRVRGRGKTITINNEYWTNVDKLETFVNKPYKGIDYDMFLDALDIDTDKKTILVHWGT